MKTLIQWIGGIRKADLFLTGVDEATAEKNGDHDGENYPHEVVRRVAPVL